MKILSKEKYLLSELLSRTWDIPPIEAMKQKITAGKDLSDVGTPAIYVTMVDTNELEVSLIDIGDA